MTNTIQCNRGFNYRSWRSVAGMLALILSSSVGFAMHAPQESLDEQLLAAVSRGKVEEAQGLLQRGANPNTRVEDKTALMIAVQGRNIQCLKALLRSEADINATDAQGRTVLMYAALWGNIASVKALLAAGANVSVVCKRGDTALMCAVRRYRRDMAKYLYAVLSREKTSSQSGLLPKNGQQVLLGMEKLVHSHSSNDIYKEIKKDLKELATSKRRLDISNIFHNLTSLLSPEYVNQVLDDQGTTPLMYAIGSLRDFSIVQVFLEKGADVNAKDSRGRSALMIALEVGEIDIALYLLLEVFAISPTEEELQKIRISEEYKKIIRSYIPVYHTIKSVAYTTVLPVDLVELSDSKMILHEVIKHVHNSDMDSARQCLLELARVKFIHRAFDDQGGTPLMYAIRYFKDLSLVKAFVLMGAEINVRDNKGRTALIEAFAVEAKDIVNYLLFEKFAAPPTESEMQRLQMSDKEKETIRGYMFAYFYFLRQQAVVDARQFYTQMRRSSCLENDAIHEFVIAKLSTMYGVFLKYKAVLPHVEEVLCLAAVEEKKKRQAIINQEKKYMYYPSEIDLECIT